MKASVKDEILSLTGLRAIAAFMVFLFHFHSIVPPDYGILINNILFHFGGLGMTIFFMLSGFVLAHRYADSATPYKKYAIHRFARIYPVYVFAAVITLPYMDRHISGGLFQDPSWWSFDRISLVTSNLLLVQAWIPQYFLYWNDGVSWSVSVEAFFYALFPLIIRFIAPLTNRQLIGVMAACYCSQLVFGVAISQITNSPLVAYSMPLFRLPEFVTGVCLFFAQKRFSQDKNSDKNFWGFVLFSLLIVYFAATGSAAGLYQCIQKWIEIPVVAFFIFYSKHEGIAANRFLSSPVMVWLGKISYSFYSIQLLPLLLIGAHHDAIIRALPLLANNALFCAVTFILLSLLSALTYYLIEAPARQWLCRKLEHP